MMKTTEASKSTNDKRAELSSSSIVGANTKDKFKLKRRTVVLLICAILCVLVTGLTFGLLRQKTPTTGPDSVKSLVEAGDSDEEMGRVVREYGTKYDSATKEVENSDPTRWNKDLLDKAYLSLLYADKIGAFSQVYDVLSSIELAQTSGLDIDNNSHDVTQTSRDAIKQRADAARAQQLQGAEGDTQSE